MTQLAQKTMLVETETDGYDYQLLMVFIHNRVAED